MLFIKTSQWRVVKPSIRHLVYSRRYREVGVCCFSASLQAHGVHRKCDCILNLTNMCSKAGSAIDGRKGALRSPSRCWNLHAECIVA